TVNTGDGGLTDGNDKELPATATSAALATTFINAVTPDYGEDDGASAAVTIDSAGDGFTFTLAGGNQATGLDTGLTLSDTAGSTVYAYLSADGRTIAGRTAADGIGNGDSVFTLTIDQATGEITQTQNEAFEHSLATDGTGTTGVAPLNGGAVTEGTYSTTPPDSVNLGALDISVSADVRTTDSDGDYVIQAVSTDDIAGGFVFFDDGPASSTVTNSASVLEVLASNLILDETRPVGTDRSVDSADLQSPNGTKTASQDLFTVFTDADSGTTGLQADYGADSAGSLAYALTLTQSGTETGAILSGIYALDTSDTSTTDGDGYGQGDQLILVDGSSLTGGTAGTIYGVLATASAAADSYFTIANSGTTVTFSQKQNVWHDDTSRFDEGGPTADSARLIVTNGSLGLQQTVTDADGDSASSTADLSGSTGTGGFSVFSIQDDGPASFAPADATLVNSAGETALNQALNVNSNTIGTDQDGSLAFDITDGTQVLGSIDGAANQQLTVNGAGLYYYVSDNGDTLTASTSTTEGDVDETNIAYTVEIGGNATAGYTYDVTTLKALDNGSGFVANSDNVTTEGGNDPYNIISFNGPGSADAPEILVTAWLSDSIPDPNTATPGSVNRSAFTWGVENAQTLSNGEQLVIDYGEFNAITTSSYSYVQSTAVQGSTVTFAKGPSGAAATFYAVNPEALDNNTNTGNTNSNLVSLDSFSVTDENGNTISIESTNTGTSFNLNGRAYDFTFADLDGNSSDYESVSITNIKNYDGASGIGDSIAIFGKQSYGRLVVENDSSDIDFGLNNFGFSSFDSGEDVSTVIDVILTDGDGDFVGSDFTVNWEPGLSASVSNLITSDVDSVTSSGDTDIETVSVTGGSGNYTYSLLNNPALSYGGFSINGQGEISFQQTSAFLHTPAPNPQSEQASSVDIRVTDTDTNATVDVTAYVNINDDGPQIDPGIFTANQTINFSTIVGDQAGDSAIDGTEGYNYNDFSKITLDFASIYQGQSINIDLNVQIDGTWNYDGRSNSTYFDDNWSVFIADDPTQAADWDNNGGPNASESPDQIYYYNSNATSNSPYPVEDPFFSATSIDSFAYAPASSTNSDVNFAHTATVAGTLDSNGNFEFWVGGQTTQTSETATINGISNVVLTTQSLDSILIPVSNTDQTYSSQNLASWDFGADGRYSTFPQIGYEIINLDSKYNSTITSWSDSGVQFSIKEGADVLAKFNLISTNDASDEVQIFNSSSEHDITFGLNIQDSDEDIDTLDFDLQISGPTSTPIANGTPLFVDTFDSNSADGWSSDDGDSKELQVNRNQTSTKTFEFGIENAGKTVNIEFDIREKKFDDDDDDSDSATLTANGSSLDITGDFGDINETLIATLDENGTLQTSFTTNADKNDEYIRVDDFTIKAGSGLIETTELGYTPIAIDLDNNGIQYLSRENGVTFEDQISGIISEIAWVAPNDGLLVIDANQSGTIDETREFVFTEWSNRAETDLQAVSEVFDTNQDGILSEQDEQFSDFAVWQDLNSDAKSDEGELFSLNELGIESVELSYTEDSEGRSDADGDVTVLGQANVNYEDGSTGLAEDTSFAKTLLSEEDISTDAIPGDSSVAEATDGLDVTSTASTSELIDQFLETNPVDDEIASQVEQELMMNEPGSDSLTTDADGVETTFENDASDAVHEDDLDLEIEVVEVAMHDSVNMGSVDGLEDYSYDGV
ncbi:DUF5801 domain-containing protein, partial [Desulfobacterales bacterium]|nr:DUF5801 domain-containing protein [Desulfobacterales bacterium]